jgi:hypothetical protein
MLTSDEYYEGEGECTEHNRIVYDNIRVAIWDTLQQMCMQPVKKHDAIIARRFKNDYGWAI